MGVGYSSAISVTPGGASWNYMDESEDELDCALEMVQRIHRSWTEDDPDLRPCSKGKSIVRNLWLT